MDTRALGPHGPNRALHYPNRLDRAIGRLPPRFRWSAGVVRMLLQEPRDAFDRISARAGRLTSGRSIPGHGFAADDEWQPRLHARLGCDWPCRDTDEFDQLWEAIGHELVDRGVRLGRGAYGGWDDGDRTFGLAVWCLTRHLRPSRTVETGVARGITSRLVLEALDRCAAGHLWSIDLPSTDPSFHGEIGSAVPERLRDRWTYISGTSRRRLPRLLAGEGPIDLFIHDSSHTERNVSFELQEAWASIRRGAVIADDIQQSAGFARFVTRVEDAEAYVVSAHDGAALIGIAIKNW